MSSVPPVHQEDLARLLLASVRDEGIFALDAAGRVSLWNPGAAAVTGYAGHEVIGMHLSRFYTPEDVQLGMPERELRNAAGQPGVPHGTQGWRVRRDGSRFWAQVTTIAMAGEDGRLVGFARVVRDITERIRADEALRLSEAKFSGIISIATDAVVSVDEDARIILFNQGAERIFGWTAAEIMGQPLDTLLPPRVRERHAHHLESFSHAPVVAKRMGERQEIFGLRKDGEEFPAEASISRLDLGGRRVMTAVLRDITDRKEAERRVAQALERETAARAVAEAAEAAAHAAVRAREDVLHVVSHDLGNSLSAIVITTTVLLRTLPQEAENDELRRRVSSIRDLARRMQRLRQDLLDVASIEAGRLAIEWDSWDPAAVAAEAVENIAPLAAEKELALACGQCEPLAHVEGDRDRILQVLANLLGNAVKFTPPGGSVSVRVTEDEREVTFSVSDSGPGIAEQDLPHVFDRFWKVREHNRHGAGLGLAISRGIVEAHDGRIWVESAPGGGSTFSFTLPLRDGEYEHDEADELD